MKVGIPFHAWQAYDEVAANRDGKHLSVIQRDNSRNRLFQLDSNSSSFAQRLDVSNCENYKFDNRPVRTWGKESNKDENSSAETAHSSGMPTDLAKKLQNVYNDYDMEDDNPVDYSLQFPETEVNSTFSSSNQPSVLKKSAYDSSTPSMRFVGKDSSDGAVHGNNQARPKIDPSVEEKVIFADKQLYEHEDTPTNFSARYSEEQVNDECLENYSVPEFAGITKNRSYTVAKEETEAVKKYNVEDTPICFSAQSSLSDLHASGNLCDEASLKSNPVAKINDHTSEYHNGEADDKLDLEPGARTPAYLLRSNRQSGFMTPRTPMYQDTPMMCYTPSDARSSLSSCDQGSIHSDVSSEPDSRMVSGNISPSDLPDSPSQSVPQSRCRSPTRHDKVSSEQPAPNSNKEIEKVQQKSTLCDLKGLELIKKAHAMSSGYLATLPQQDEMRSYNVEKAMSVMTGLSGLTIDGEKIKPLENEISKSVDGNNIHKDVEGMLGGGNQAVMQAGYVTSLPTSDEIKHFHLEGTMSPLTGLSEISALHSHNEGFQKDLCHLGRGKKSNRNSCTSRSSATGASVPLPPITQHVDDKEEASAKKQTTSKVAKCTPDDIPHLRDDSEKNLQFFTLDGTERKKTTDANIIAK